MWHSAECNFAKCSSGEFHFAKCSSVEFHFAKRHSVLYYPVECHSARSVILLNIIMLDSFCKVSFCRRDLHRFAPLKRFVHYIKTI
jgi:hypothetical protein